MRSPTRFGPCSAAIANTTRMAMKITRCTMHSGQGSWCLTYCRNKPKPISPLENNAPHRYSQRLEIFFQRLHTLFRLIDPCRLYRLKHLFAAVLRVIVKIFQRQHPVVQVGEAQGLRVDLGVRFRQFDGDQPDISPFHLWVSFAMLMVYFGTSPPSLYPQPAP